jgi:hypothetical protein
MPGMNVKYVVFRVLDVGQGACNYVEIYNQAEAVVHNMLVDLGTNSSQAIATANIEWLKNQIKDRTNPKIDVVMLTHGDNDHYNLMLKLLPALGSPTGQEIGMVRYGGVDWRYKIGNTSLITELKKYCSNVTGFGSQASGYDRDKSSWTRLWPSNDVFQPGDAQLYVLMANTQHPQDGTIRQGASRRPNAEAINSKSVVFGVYWNYRWFIGTGDGTAATLAQVNTHFAGVGLPPTMSMTLPHHGSRKTTYDLKAAKDAVGAESFKVVDDFLQLFKPWTISVSADEKRHHHPSLLMIAQFAAATQTTQIYWCDPSLAAGNHYLTPWIDERINQPTDPAYPGQPTYATTRTQANVYSTLYCDRRLIINYESPPLPANKLPKPTMAVDTSGVPRGRNWYFISDGTNLSLQSASSNSPATTSMMTFIGRAAAAGPSRNAAYRTTQTGLRATPGRFAQQTHTNMTRPPALITAAPPAGSQLRVRVIRG